MRTRRAWIFIACTLLPSVVLVIAAHGCDNETWTMSCPHLDGTGYFDSWCSQCQEQPSVLPGCNRCLIDKDLGPSYACYYYKCDIDSGVLYPACPDAGDGSTSSTTDGATGCAGDCVPAPPYGWEGPGPVWFGAPGQAPACPSKTSLAYEGQSLVEASAATCTCTCSAASGTCSPPLQITTSSLPCGAGGPPSRDFGPPPGWDGSCTEYDSIAQGELCDGIPCAVSVTAGPLVVTQSCTPSEASIEIAGASSYNEVLGCVAHGECLDQALRCQIAAPGFKTCIYQYGEHACPDGYPDKHVVALGYTDARGCTGCTCGAPDGSCTARLEIFEEAGCLEAKQMVALNLPGASCEDLPKPGVALQSKRFRVVAYDAGACVPGGAEVVGEVEPEEPSTFCCAEPPDAGAGASWGLKSARRVA